VLLYQLLYNLVNNSLKFVQKDVPPVITITSAISNEQQEWVTLAVKDNGIGFAQEYAEKIFESFTRLNSKDQFEGTGLGLALCQRIAERHGGRIDAIGKPGEGACFWVRLPLRQNRSSI
jgi:signal transduction histidine kinase